MLCNKYTCNDVVVNMLFEYCLCECWHSFLVVVVVVGTQVVLGEHYELKLSRSLSKLVLVLCVVLLVVCVLMV